MLLQASAPSRADRIIVFPKASHPEPDSISVLTVLKLQAMLGGDRETRLIVWCADARNVDVFLDPRFHLTDVCSTEWAWRIVCQATRVQHVSNIYRHLMTSSAESNEFYEYRICEGCPPMTFGEAQEAFLRYNADASTEVSGGGGTCNTLLLVGFVKADDERRERIRLNPSAEEMLESDDVLIFLTYVFTEEIAIRLGRYLSDAGA